MMATVTVAMTVTATMVIDLVRLSDAPEHHRFLLFDLFCRLAEWVSLLDSLEDIEGALSSCSSFLRLKNALHTCHLLLL